MLQSAFNDFGSEMDEHSTVMDELIENAFEAWIHLAS